MMKKQNLTWGWRDHARTNDPAMTRQRLARLMRCWRRSRTQGRPDYELVRLAPGIYRIADARYSPTDYATFSTRGL